MSKPKKDKELNKLTGIRLKEAIRAKYKSNKDFICALEQIDENYSVTEQHLSSTLTGKATLTREKAIQYAKVLDVSYLYLLGDEPDRNEAEKKARELSERLSEMHDHIREVESPDGAMRKDIRSFFRFITLSDHEYQLQMVSAKDYPSAYDEPDDFMKACQLEIGSMTDPSYFEDFNLYNSFIVAIDIDGTEYSLINGEFKKLVYSTIEAVKQTVNNALTFASIHNASASASI